MRKIIFASHNKGKFDELVDDFAAVGIELVMPETPLNLPEWSELLSENAYTKAKAAAEETGLVALGDDSGVFVEALDYMPGVHSRRWFGADDDDECRNRKILELMENEETNEDRRTYLISRFSVVSPDGSELAKAMVKNEYNLSFAPAGSNGFGYDRILIPAESMWENMVNNNPNYSNSIFSEKEKNKTIAELTQQQKNMITYRGRIAKNIAAKINNKGGSNNEKSK